jgi:hypothetical protein
MVFHGAHLLDETLIDHTPYCADAVTTSKMSDFDKQKGAQ